MRRLVRFLVRRRNVGGFLLGALYLWLARPLWWSILLGFMIMLPGLALRIWASGHIRKGRELAAAGPYALVRNPLYLGSFIAGLGVCVMGLRSWAVGLFALLFLLVYIRKMADEEKHLARLYGEAYGEYQRSVPRFIPRCRKPGKNGGFDWALVLEHREWELWLGLAAVTAALAVKAFAGG